MTLAFGDLEDSEDDEDFHVPENHSKKLRRSEIALLFLINAIALDYTEPLAE